MNNDDQEKPSNAAPQPLRGVRILDFTAMMAGPYATRMLSDLGAEVIKVESAEGDHIRRSPPVRNGASAYFGHLNAGKQSIVLDLKNPEAIETIFKLCENVDAVVENFRPGVMKRLGLDYETLAARFPKLIYCSVSGFGQSGPDAKRPAYAQVVQALSGYDSVQQYYQDGAAGERPPNAGIFVGDVVTALYAVIALQSALLQRAVTGKGQHLDVTLIESMLNMLPYEFQEAQFPAPQRRHVYKPVKALDGFLMIVPVSHLNFLSVCDAIDRPDLKDSPRFGPRDSRIANYDEFTDIMEAWTSTRTVAECEAKLSEHGVPAARYQTVRDNLSNPTLAARGSFARVEDAGGTMLIPNLPFKMGESRPSVGASVAGLGADTERVLSSLAGLSADEIDRLRKSGALGKKPA
ncbi:MAG: CaiB/BaiF CoA transferase family protein [Janthinobacterium lividum]